ncbi:MAG: hypothetical protein U0984_00275, partial [Prosthecobacter sp.]|nr:hypothetical protein [Prosthecobacter sp.]
MKFGSPYITVTLIITLGLGIVSTVLWFEGQGHGPDAQVTTVRGQMEARKREPTEPVSQTTMTKPEAKGPLPNIDLRLEGLPVEPLLPLPRSWALAKLKEMFPGLAVEFDPITKSPKWIGSNTGLLSRPQAGLAAKDADAPVRQFIDAHREVFGHGSDRLDSARRVTDYTTPRSSSRKVVWHQQLDGVDIFEAVFQANLTANSELINVGSHLVADPE